MSEDQSRGSKPTTVEEYLTAVPVLARSTFEQLRMVTHSTLKTLVGQGVIAGWEEKLSYGILGYVPAGQRRAFAFISAFKDHVGIYPIPEAPHLDSEIARYKRGKGTLWFPLDEPLPEEFIQQALSVLMTAEPKRS